MQGKILWYNPELGYGFISDTYGNQIFFQKSALPKGKVRRRDKVTFRLIPYKNSIQAVDIQKMQV